MAVLLLYMDAYYTDANKTHEEKARWQPHKNDSAVLKKILEAAPKKTVAVRPLTSYLINHPSKANKTCSALLEKQRQAHKRRSFYRTPVLADQQELTSLRVDSEFILEDRPGAIDDRDG